MMLHLPSLLLTIANLGNSLCGCEAFPVAHRSGTPVRTLEPEHPARIFRRQFADFVQLFQVFVVEFQIHRAEIVLQLTGFLCADNDARNGWLMQQPTERHLRDRSVTASGDFLHHVDNVISLRFIHRRERELRAPRFTIGGAVTREFAGEKSARQRTPHQQSDSLIQQHRNNFTLQLAAGQRVVSLQRHKFFEMLHGGNSLALHDLPRREIGASDVADFSLTDQIGERAERFFKRRQWIEAVNLIEIDVIRIQAQQAGLGFLHDIQPRESDLIGTFAHAAVDFGRNHHILALRAERFAQHGFRFARRIDIGRVEEIDAGVDGVFHQRIHVVLIQSADGLEDAFRSAEGHCAHAKFGYEDTGIPELLIFHEASSSYYAYRTATARERYPELPLWRSLAVAVR